MATPKVPAAPAGTGPSGRRLWHDVLAAFELDEHELALLREALRTVDLLDDLTAVVAAEGSMMTNSKGERVVHPAVVEARQQKIALTRLIASLRLPEGDEDARPQRRGAARGTYRPRAVS